MLSNDRAFQAGFFVAACAALVFALCHCSGSPDVVAGDAGPTSPQDAPDAGQGGGGLCCRLADSGAALGCTQASPFVCAPDLSTRGAECTLPRPDGGSWCAAGDACFYLDDGGASGVVEPCP